MTGGQCLKHIGITVNLRRICVKSMCVVEGLSRDHGALNGVLVSHGALNVHRYDVP